MSADNWTVCPACLKRIRAEQVAAPIRLAEAYGKVSLDEWKAMEAAMPSADASPDCTLREDYEFHMSDEGAFTAGYRAKCAACGWEYRFSHTEVVPS